MKKILVCILGFIMVSCNKGKTEFVQSQVYRNLYLVKNMPDNLISRQKVIQEFIIGNSLNNDTEFYKYSGDTKYFLDHEEDPGGFSSEELQNYRENDGIASLFFMKCKKDSMKKEGILRYYQDEYTRFYAPDTIIFECR
ncbi:hypothetical protein [Chryseobacterium sp. BIGb0232]|uniref:hypothetical protein n=1 Tax=Chryseobacterium sp. BIGb0232 TaxID=2940598 RepID=UPI000FA48B48|nr:hypothetical protein [Chryseobacterium sp. BIGb0232]MCS4305098.1 hypothetical protein [Chryseobacterium sp. BIGb0232]ROS08086.1 hypothetical protein EDF65_4535 [Chryseobacterium nakagawai]